MKSRFETQLQRVSVWITFFVLLGTFLGGYINIVTRLARIEERNLMADERQKAIELKIDKALGYTWEGAGR